MVKPENFPKNRRGVVGLDDSGGNGRQSVTGQAVSEVVSITGAADRMTGRKDGRLLTGQDGSGDILPTYCRAAGQYRKLSSAAVISWA